MEKKVMTVEELKEFLKDNWEYQVIDDTGADRCTIRYTYALGKTVSEQLYKPHMTRQFIIHKIHQLGWHTKEGRFDR